MNPHSEPASARRLDALYRTYARSLVGIVAARLGRSRAMVEDGCQQAWAILARRPDVLDGPAPRAWLVTVAVRECLAETRGAADPLDGAREPLATPLEDVIDAREALRMVAALRPVRRRVFARRLAGLSYAEIAAEQGLTYTNVNRQITESRAELRAAA
jgi:RNA polymerase sigma factor (sigma-70 family)